MKIRLYICLLGMILLFSCYGVNEKTSEIFVLSSCCNNDSTWINMYNSHKIENVEDKKIQEIIHEFKKMPFSNHILYFKDYPEEYIGISEGGTSIRYIYNKDISDNVLDGLSPQLSDSEKMRIGLRVNSVIFNYLNEEGRNESAIILKYQCEEFIKNYKKQ